MPPSAITSASPSVPTVTPTRARRDLDPGQGDRLVGLDVRPQGHAQIGHRVGHPPRVRLDDVEVDDEAGRVEIGRQRGRYRDVLGGRDQRLFGTSSPNVNVFGVDHSLQALSAPYLTRTRHE